MTVIRFSRGTRRNSHAIVGVAGPSGGGKTLSGLMIARGLADGDDAAIAAADTENGRMTHYFPLEGQAVGPRLFQPEYFEMAPPFGPSAYQQAIAAAVALKPKPKVIMIDSFSHENDGEGGILEMHDAELDRMVPNKSDWEKRDKLNFTAWIKPKREHNKLLNFMLQQKVHFVLCFRAKDKIAPVKNSKGKTEFMPVGWTPICADRLEYEATCLVILPPNARGVPDLTAERSKIQEQHEYIFPAGKALSEQTGRDLAAGCRGAAGPGTSASRTPAAQRAEPPAATRADDPSARPPADPSSSSPSPAGSTDAGEPTGAAAPAPTRAAAPADQSALAGESGGPSASPAANVAGTGQAPADETSQARKDQREIYNGLYASLQKADDPRAWWKDHTRSLQFLEEAAADLHADLVKLAKTKQTKKAAAS